VDAPRFLTEDVLPVDDRATLMNDLAQKREKLQSQAQRSRELRDRMNDETKRQSAKRDEFNGQVRGLVERANGHKAKRDELNAKVHEAKAKRDELNKEAHAKSEALNALRRERGASAAPGVSPSKLRAEIKHLEYQQQTTVLTPKKEKELIDLIGSKLKELKEREASFQESADLKVAYEAMRAAKASAEAQHQAVTVLANEAQGEHDAMVKLFNEADGLRKQADAAQGDFVRSKMDADRVHREYIETVTAVRDVEKVLYALRNAGRPAGERAMESQHAAPGSAQAEADEIFDKFRKGEKLSTEDLMALQKAGRL
jgi:uncharacterized coiled-coil DUF342 family protein